MINISMSTWNVASILPGFEKRFARIASRIPLNTSMFIIQEGGDLKKSGVLLDALNARYGGVWRMTKAGTGQVLFTRSDVWTATSHRLVKLGAAKAALLVKVEHSTGAPLVVVNVHLSPYSTAARRALRARQIRTLVAEVDSFAGGLPVIMAGDFNDGDKGVHRFLLSRGWVYQKPSNRQKTTVPGKPGVPIDRFYVNRAIAFYFPKVRIDSATDRKFSDHYRVGAVINFRPNK